MKKVKLVMNCRFFGMKSKAHNDSFIIYKTVTGLRRPW